MQWFSDSQGSNSVALWCATTSGKAATVSGTEILSIWQNTGEEDFFFCTLVLYHWSTQQFQALWKLRDYWTTYDTLVGEFLLGCTGQVWAFRSETKQQQILLKGSLSSLLRHWAAIWSYSVIKLTPCCCSNQGQRRWLHSPIHTHIRPGRSYLKCRKRRV